MKIEKGHTIEQFIDIMETGTKYNGETFEDDYHTIVAYKDIYKQPLKKEQFINEVDRHLNTLPTDTHPHQFYLDKFQEAENKVIFKGWKKSIHYKYAVINGSMELNFENADYPVFSNRGISGVIQTKGDLFQATKGELITQNITL